MLKKRKVSSKTANKTVKKCVYPFSWVRDWIVRHPKVGFVFLLICLLIFPLALLGLIQALGQWAPLGSFAQLSNSGETWLSFWGSYLGCVATVILSIVALRLSKEINKYAWYKNTADEIESFHQFRVEKISLYNLALDQPKELDYFSGYNNERFMLAVSFQSFPPYYDIDLQPLEIFSCDANKTKLALDSVQPQFINAGEHSYFYYLFNAGEDLRKFMLLHIQGANIIPHAQRQRCIHLSMLCKNTLYGADPGYYRPFSVNLRIWAVNAKAARPNPDEAEKYTEFSLPLEVIRQTVSCSPAS